MKHTIFNNDSTVFDFDEKGKELLMDGEYHDRDLHGDGNKVNAQEQFFEEAYERSSSHQAN